MRNYRKFYINGQWRDEPERATIDVVNPANKQVAGIISVATAADVDLAVKAARRAFPSWSKTGRAERIEVLTSIKSEYEKRFGEIAAAITEEMGAPASLSQNAQAAFPLKQLSLAIETLEKFRFEEDDGETRLVKEAIGVCGLITPWNWPLAQIIVKVAPALATGCTVVLKPSEIAPFSAYLFAEIVHAAGLPPGVFNLVNGDGPATGSAISKHPGIDMISFTGSTKAGIQVAQDAASTVKRVTQELGGKSPNIILEDADFLTAVTRGTRAVMMNSGQTCSAPTRMLVPRSRAAEAIEIARKVVEGITVGDPQGNVDMGPVACRAQWKKVQDLIQRGIAEGATLVTGGVGYPDGLSGGFYVRPTVFSDVTEDMAIAREEIFGPVLSILSYETVNEAINLGNNSEYGLSAYVNGNDYAAVREIASRLRAGQVSINGAIDFSAPFGGYRKSGNGREWGEAGFAEYLETKALMGFSPP